MFIPSCTHMEFFWTSPNHADTDLRQKWMLPIPPGFAGQGTAGRSQPNRVALRKKKRAAQQTISSNSTHPKKAGVDAKIPPEATAPQGSAALLPGVSVSSIHPHSLNGQQYNQASSVGNPRISNTAWEIKTQRKDEREFCFLNRSLSFFAVLWSQKFVSVSWLASLLQTPGMPLGGSKGAKGRLLCSCHKPGRAQVVNKCTGKEKEVWNKGETKGERRKGAEISSKADYGGGGKAQGLRKKEKEQDKYRVVAAVWWQALGRADRYKTQQQLWTKSLQRLISFPDSHFTGLELRKRENHRLCVCSACLGHPLRTSQNPKALWCVTGGHKELMQESKSQGSHPFPSGGWLRKRLPGLWDVGCGHWRAHAELAPEQGIKSINRTSSLMAGDPSGIYYTPFRFVGEPSWSKWNIFFSSSSSFLHFFFFKEKKKPKHALLLHAKTKARTWALPQDPEVNFKPFHCSR